MRIAIFTEVFLPKIDGITNRLRHTIECLLDQGHKVLVFGPLHAQGSLRDARVVQIPGVPFPPYPELQISFPDARIITRLARFRPDIVHAVGPASLGVLGIAAARTLGFPVIASYHTDLPAYLSRYGLDLAEPTIWPAIRVVHNQAHHNLCPSRATRDELEARGIAPVGIWRGGVDTERFRPEATTGAMRLRLTPAAQRESVRALALYVGRVSPEKNLERFFDLHDAIPGLHVAIVGDGPDRERLEAKASGRRIHFTGFLRENELAAAYSSADLFFMPSTTETLGFVVLEAMSSGTPAVAADAGGVRDLIVHGENGLLFDPSKPQQAITQVRQLIERPSQRKHFARQARKFAEKGSWHEETLGLVANYNRTIEKARRTDLLTRMRLGSKRLPRSSPLAGATAPDRDRPGLLSELDGTAMNYERPSSTLLLAQAAIHYDAKAKLPKHRTVWLAHSLRDTLIDIGDSRRLATTGSPRPVRLIEVDDDHSLHRSVANGDLVEWVRGIG